MQSQIDTKRIARNSIVLYFRMLFQMAVFLYTSRILLSALGVENYGIYDVVAGLVLMLSFLNNSLTSCSQRFITYAIGKNDTQYLKNVCSASIFVHLIMALMVLLLGETIGLWYVLDIMIYPPEKFWDVMFVYQSSLLSGLFLIVSIPYNATIIAYERMNVYAFITIADTILKLLSALVLSCICEGWRLPSYAIMMLVVATITRLAYAMYCHHNFPVLRFRLKNNAEILKEMFSFFSWSILGNTSIAMNTQGLNLVLNYFFGPVLNAARGVAFQIQMAVTQFIASFQMAVNPQITKSYAQGDIALANSIVLRSSRLSFMLVMSMAIPLYIEAPMVLQVWLGKIPEHSIGILRLLLLVSIVDAVSNPLMVAAAATGRIKKYQIYVGGTLMSVLPLSVLMLQFFKVPECVFVVLFLVTLLVQCIRVWLCHNIFSLDVREYFVDVLYRILLTSIFAVLLPILLSLYFVETSFLSLIIRIVFDVGWIVIIILLFGLKRDERTYVFNKIGIQI